MSIGTRRGLFLLLSVVLVQYLPAAERVVYRAVDPEDLKENPEHYWLDTIAFRDELVSPPGTRRIALAGERYVVFKTRIVGHCAASPEVAEKIRSLETGRTYFFQGTVLARGRNFHVVVGEVSPALEVEDAAGALETDAGRQYADANIRRLLEVVETALFTLSQTKGVPMSELLRWGSEYESQVLDTIQGAILRDSRVSGVTAEMILSRLIYRALVSQKGKTAPGPLRTGPLGPSEAAAADEPAGTGRYQKPGPRLRVGILRVKSSSTGNLSGQGSLPVPAEAGAAGDRQVVPP